MILHLYIKCKSPWKFTKLAEVKEVYYDDQQIQLAKPVSIEKMHRNTQFDYDVSILIVLKEKNFKENYFINKR